jgi:hypothetical protein
MKIGALYLRERRMRLKHPFQGSLGTTLDPRVLFVEVHSDGLVERGEITSGMGPFHSPEMPSWWRVPTRAPHARWHCYSEVRKRTAPAIAGTGRRRTAKICAEEERGLG